MAEPLTVPELIDTGHRVLSDSTRIFEDHDNLAEARELLAHTLRIDLHNLHDLDDEVPKRERERYLAMIARRAAGEPFPMLVGYIHFYGLDLRVRPGAFVPRPSSELTVERALRRLKGMSEPAVVDVCTGAGPIAIAIADERSDAEVWGTDIEEQGLRQGRENAKRLGVSNVKLRRGDMYGALPKRLRGQVDLITGHVPYVPPDELDDLPEEVRDHEPIHTLSDLSDDGLGLMRHTINEAPEWLRPGGWLLLEMSDDLAKKAKRMCEKVGFERPKVASDDDDLSIVVEARKPKRAK